eukprot:1086932-Pyramimonas_sp.AAC.1
MLNLWQAPSSPLLLWFYLLCVERPHHDVVHRLASRQVSSRILDAFGGEGQLADMRIVELKAHPWHRRQMTQSNHKVLYVCVLTLLAPPLLPRKRIPHPPAKRPTGLFLFKTSLTTKIIAPN